MNILKINSLKELLRLEDSKLDPYDGLKVLLIIEDINKENIQHIISKINHKKLKYLYITLENNSKIDNSLFNILLESLSYQSELEDFNLFVSEYYY